MKKLIGTPINVKLNSETPVEPDTVHFAAKQATAITKVTRQIYAKKLRELEREYAQVVEENNRDFLERTIKNRKEFEEKKEVLAQMYLVNDSTISVKLA